MASETITQENSMMTTFKQLSRNPVFYPLMGFLCVFIIMVVVTDNFLTANNLTNIGRQVSVNAIIAVGMTFAILTSGIDLAVGSVMALSGTIMAGLMAGGMPMSLSILIGLGLGSVLGAINGLLIAYAKMPAFIVTLAMLGIARGLALIYTGGYPISGLDKSFALFGRGSIMGIETPIFIMLIVYAVAYVVLTYTPFGRHVYAVGGNAEASRLSGIKVSKILFLVYTISGFTSALAGLILTSRLMSGQPNAGVAFELDAIAAVVLGGAAMNGGKGTIIGTLIGALLLGVLNNGLNLIGINPYVQNVIKGIIILIAIYVGTEKKKARS
ncbi:Ribose transport system permease protein rbsC [Anaerobiospirillum thomasii]|uniref:Ribose transport system permease protein rbsC n=2 Tax=Anaerobiospirillum thomasii TaxID=179995 RepID=A0A2X0VE23_9GAMM|nr:Ribose transport system permease protein rbsC [Anaerobiospirillum thomasii]SPT71436.1 Ribose transport system permease protein rbsC [Anaerobiospirillum thomasii]